MPDKAMFGRFWPGTSPVHRMDPRAKLLLSLALMVATFCAQNYGGLAVCAAFVVGFYAVAGIPLGQALRSIGPLLFIVVVTALLNVFFVQGGTVLFEWWIIRISEAGLQQAAFIACRLLLLLLGMSLLTLTTATLDITDAFEYLLHPFRRIGVPAHELSMMMGIALRFLPQFAFELQTVYRAQISRGATFSKGRLRMLASLMVPLFTSAFRHAETLSSAMEARCYHGGVGRTRLHVFVIHRAQHLLKILAIDFARIFGANTLVRNNGLHAVNVILVLNHHEMGFKNLGLVAKGLACFLHDGFDLGFRSLDRGVHARLLGGDVLNFLFAYTQIGFAQDKCLGLDQSFRYA